jgi:alkylation response protein AidB-like acyl-CoA dehydrogenase
LEDLELAFDGLRVPAANMLGEEGKAFYTVAAGLEVGRVLTAARSIVCTRGALEDALVYAQGPVQFGEPIANFQAIRFKLANMATEVEAARQLMYFRLHSNRQWPPM